MDADDATESGTCKYLTYRLEKVYRTCIDLSQHNHGTDSSLTIVSLQYYLITDLKKLVSCLQ